jgi:hypothetical protein
MTTKVTITNEGPRVISVSNIDINGGTSSGMALLPGYTTTQYVWGQMEIVINEQQPEQDPT